MLASPFARYPFSMALAEAVDPFEEDLPVYFRGELGVSPDTEIVHSIGTDYSRTRHTLRRGQEGTDAADWPAGTPLTWLTDGTTYDGPANVQNLPKALPAAATEVNLHRAYRRVKIGSEIIWQIGNPGGVPGGGPHQLRLEVQRAKEGTTAALHSAAAEVVFLAAGES